MSETQDAIEGSQLIPLSDLVINVMQEADSIYNNIISPLGESKYFYRTGSLDAGALQNIKKSLQESDLIKEFFSTKKSFADLDFKYRIEVYEKIKNSGLLNLIEQVGGIREFAQKRFSNAEFLRRISC
jgi:hypothetical protein